MGEESIECNEGKLIAKNGEYSPVKQTSTSTLQEESSSSGMTADQQLIRNDSQRKMVKIQCDKVTDSSPRPSPARLNHNGTASNGKELAAQTMVNGKVALGDAKGKEAKDNPPSKQEDEEGDDEYELVPPDGGWGWLVLAGSMLVNILVPGTIKSFGVLFVEFLEAFQATPSAAAWIPALCYFLYSSLGPLSSILSVKYSYRTVTIIGGTFAAAGMIITYWATSVNFLYVSYGVLVGTGAGLAFPPTVYIVTSYFVKLRGLANGLCISGSALGSIILPPVLRYLLVNFGYRGACMIMGGITLNVWVAAIFYQPVEQHMKRVKKVKETAQLMEDDTILEESETNEDLAVIQEIDRPAIKPKFMITGDDTPAETPTMEHKSPDVFNYNPKNGLIDSFARSVSAAAVPMSYQKDEFSSRTRKISTPIRHEHRNLTFTSQLSETQGSHLRLSRLNSMRNIQRGGPKRSPSTSSFQYISTPYHGSTLSTHQPREFASHLSLRSIADSFKPSSKQPGDKSQDDSNRSKFFDLTLLKDPTYLVILISNSTNAIGYTNFIILLPAYAITLGFDKSLAAYLLSIVSTLDLVGRIGGSALSDTNLIPKTWYFVGGLSISGLALAMLPLATSYTMVSVFCALFGLASGTYVGITAVIMADMLGTERLTSSYGISLFVNGILQLVGPPICGVIFESIGRYQPLFTALGFTLLGGSALWGFMPIIRRNKKRRAAQLAAEKEELGKGLIA
ncbi:monocarboxylate transporter 12 [Uranotaenia lowii]|uniref:monocarboxylate transporter 12 n=1 Tax=Uranotaenia lowii TaxID=190385 RepID=UPI002478D439|nr:monocarboxylate transporter 12 [Uranotaenia lowii]XP_055584898.1 monocarboxylate transporter 12 [Uranotaenia lowii]